MVLEEEEKMGSNNEETVEFVEAEDANGNGDWHGNMRMRLGDPSKVPKIH